MSKLLSWFESQLNERLVFALKLLGLLLLFALYLELRDSAQLLMAQAEQARARALSLTAVDAEAIWVDRADRVKGAAKTWEKANWRASTAGVAAAEIQALLEKLGKDAEFDRISARVEPEPLLVDGKTVLRFDVTARADQPAILHFISEISLHLPRFIATDISTNFSDRASSLRLSGIAPFEPLAAEEINNEQ